MVRNSGAQVSIADTGNGESTLVRELKEALRATKKDLQTSIGRLEKSRQALKISNERGNAINEELERSQAELHFLHEQLTAVNQQLQSKLSELDAAASQKTLAGSLEAHVRERTTRLRMLTAELTLTEERERRQLAQDLHDGLGQLLAILKIKLTSIKERERRGTFRGALKEIENLVDQSNQSVRTLMMQLNPPVLQALGLIPALEWLAEEMDRVYGLSVEIDRNGEQIALMEPAKTTIFRAVRELLINVSKHAACKSALVHCRCDGDSVKISVTDQGGGFFHDEGTTSEAGDCGFGLISIRDRIEFIGGEMSIDTAPGRGTTVTIVFPLPKLEQTIQGGA